MWLTLELLSTHLLACGILTLMCQWRKILYVVIFRYTDPLMLFDLRIIKIMWCKIRIILWYCCHTALTNDHTIEPYLCLCFVSLHWLVVVKQYTISCSTSCSLYHEYNACIQGGWVSVNINSNVEMNSTKNHFVNVWFIGASLSKPYTSQ